MYLRVLALAAIFAVASSFSDDGELNRHFQRDLIAEVGTAAYTHHSALFCGPDALPSDVTCAIQGSPTGSVDYPWGAPQIAYPTDGTPWGVHLAGPAADGKSYIVSWYTGAPSVGPNVMKPDTSALKTYASVQLIPGGGVRKFKGSVITYLRAYTDPVMANYNYLSAYIHHAVLIGLSPNSTYAYQLGHRNGSLVGAYSFTTLPVRGAKSVYPLRIGLIADVGQTINSSDTRDHLAANKPHVIIHVGDNTYADTYNYASPNKTGGGGTNQNRWDSHAQLWQSLFSTVPVLQCAGNHEIESSGIAAVINYTTTSFSYPTNYPFQSYSARMPVPGTTANFGDITANLYYSTVVGGVVTLITLNNYVPFHAGTPQYVWAMAEFAKVDRKKTPWLIVQFHTPPYHNYYVHYKEMECFLSVWEDVFYSNGVDLIFNGHVHAYERSHPVYKYQPDTCGPMYVVVGDGGNVEGLYRDYVDNVNNATNLTLCTNLKTGGVDPVTLSYTNPSGWGPAYQRQAHAPNCTTLSFQPASGVAGGPPVVQLNSTQPPVGFCQTSQPLWSAFRDPSFGHAILELQSDTVAKLQWFKNSAGNKVVADEVLLERLSSCANRQAGSAGHRRSRMMA